LGQTTVTVTRIIQPLRPKRILEWWPYVLKQAVIRLKQRRIVVLDLSGMETVDGSGLGMLVFLHR
jgi:ABC-type transporter Mla MlaB component